MSSPALLLRLEGPLQSWGLRSRWDIRDTGGEPSKSGVIGLLGCALGYRRGDARLEDLDRQLALGVRVEREGEILVDYHTITGTLPTAEGKYKGKLGDLNTIVSERAYLQDAAFLAVLAGPGAILEECASAVQSPAWPLYLGRKSCPATRPIFDGVDDSDRSLEEILRQQPWEAGGSSGSALPERLRCVVEDSQGEAERTDAIRASPARMYGARRVHMFWVEPPLAKGGQ